MDVGAGGTFFYVRCRLLGRPLRISAPEEVLILEKEGYHPFLLAGGSRTSLGAEVVLCRDAPPS